MRKLWSYGGKLDWNDVIPAEIQAEWVKFFVEFARIECVEIKRCLKPENVVGDPSLIIFSDASSEA